MILVVDMNWKRDSLGYYEFVMPILEVAREVEECRVTHYFDLDREDLSESRIIVLSGTALKDNATLSQPEKFSWLRDMGKPVLGICAGMQTFSVVFGISLIRCVEIGMIQMTTLKENRLFSGSFRAYSLHNYSIEPSKDFEVLAVSSVCVQAVKHKEKQIYGVLFHPEVRNPEILQRFIQLK